MEQLFNDLQQYIAGKMGADVSLIDEDYGQLEALINGEAQYPVTFPCVLIGIPETQWDNLKGCPQHGRATLSVRLAFDCNTDTSNGSTREQRATERMQLASRLSGYLHGWTSNGCNATLARRISRQFSRPGGIKVYETEYGSTVDDEIQNSDN